MQVALTAMGQSSSRRTGIHYEARLDESNDLVRWYSFLSIHFGDKGSLLQALSEFAVFFFFYLVSSAQSTIIG